jgi:hypothetical protein
MSLEERAKQALTELFDASSADDRGRAQIDTARVTDIVRRDREAVAFLTQRIL